MTNETQILTVSELTKEIRRTLEESFQQVSVIGEISNFKPDCKHAVHNRDSFYDFNEQIHVKKIS